MNEWARKLYANEKLAQGKFREELAQVIEQSAFKLVNQLEAKKEYEQAAEAYMTFVGEFPKSKLADKALFNASIDFYNAKMLDKSIETRKRLIAQYPKSPHVPPSIYANGEAAEAIEVGGEAPEQQCAMRLVQRFDHVRRQLERAGLLLRCDRDIGAAWAGVDDLGQGAFLSTVTGGI